MRDMLRLYDNDRVSLVLPWSSLVAIHLKPEGVILYILGTEPLLVTFEENKRAFDFIEQEWTRWLLSQRPWWARLREWWLRVRTTGSTGAR